MRPRRPVEDPPPEVIRRQGWIVLAVGLFLLAVAVPVWWSQWNVPPGQGDSHLLLGLPFVGLLLTVVGLVMILRRG